jgi:hypothetical protein
MLLPSLERLFAFFTVIDKKKVRISKVQREKGIFILQK